MGATINIQELLTDDKLDAMMRKFDLDDDEEITPEEIKKAFTKLGKDLNDSEIQEIMDVHDLDNNGVINKEEFRKIFDN